MSQNRPSLRRPIYNVDYFCLTDENFILIKRNNDIIQIKPSEFQDGDLLQTVDDKDNIIWTNATRTVSTVKAGEKIAHLNTRGGYFTLTPRHCMFLSNKEKIAAGNITVGDVLWSTPFNPLPDDSPIGVSLAYILGAFAAEGTSQSGKGSCGTGKWRVEFGLHYNEVDFATKIVQSLVSIDVPFEINPIVKRYKEYTRTTVSVFSKELVEYFGKIGALGLCFEKRVPSCILSSTKKEKSAYIAAIFEGDATVQDDRCIKLKLTSKALIDGVHVLLSSLGINSKLNFEKSVKENEKDKYCLFVYGKDNIGIFLKHIGPFLHTWKHLTVLNNYCDSPYKTCKYTKNDIITAISKCTHLSLKTFVKETGIPQSTIDRLYGSWNQCLKENGFKVNGSRWGKDYHTNINVPKYGFSTECKVNSVDLIEIKNDILVYDFTAPEYSRFLIANVVSHNTGSQASIYIGDVYIDECNAIEFNLFHERQPIYGYASRLYDDLTEGHVIVQGQLSINFKEAGYLWLVLKRYRQMSHPFVKKQGGGDSGLANRYNIEQIVNGEASQAHKQQMIEGIAAQMKMGTAENLNDGIDIANDVDEFFYPMIRDAGHQNLRGFSSMTRAQGGIGEAENIFETFENVVWKRPNENSESIAKRRCDDPKFGSFDIYLTFGDFLGDNSVNHTIVKLVDVNILGDSMIIRSDDGIPISEIYSFIAKDKV